MIGYGSIRPVQVLCVVMLVATALVLGGCGGDSGPAAAPQGTISGITYDAATGDPTDVPIVIAMAQSEVRATSAGIEAAQASPGAYTINVPPGTYAIQCYVEHKGEQYFGDKREDVVVRSSQDTSGQDLTAPSVITAHTFSSDGEFFDPWYWLRDNDPPAAPPGWLHTGHWEFSGINRNRDITAHFWMLVTNQADGGAGYDTTVSVSYTGNHGPTAVNLYLPPSGSPPDQQYPPFPEGYATRATQGVNQNYVTTGGDLDIDVGRLVAHSEHVGTHPDSIWLVNY